MIRSEATSVTVDTSPQTSTPQTSTQQTSARPASPAGGVTLAQASALRTIETEIAGMQALRDALANGLSEPFGRTIETISQARGRVIITGIGKSGHVGAKIAATLASTGTPSFFVHATEASHGDLGMITDEDVVIALSWSGETQELAATLAYTRRFKVPLVAITSRSESALGKAADIVLALPRVEEACPHGLAPTTSTVVLIALGALRSHQFLQLPLFKHLAERAHSEAEHGHG